MVEISNKTSQVVYFPKTYAGSTTSLSLRIHSELSQKDWYFDVQDLASLRDYYKFQVDFTQVDEGEFNYYIKIEDDVVDSGLIRIGVVKTNNSQYYDEPEVIQYDMYSDPEIRYQSKSVSYDQNGEYTVLPDEGYAALSDVHITVDVPSYSGGTYESGYTDGFAAGYDSGKTDGWQPGYNSGYTDGVEAASGSSYSQGYTDGEAAQKAKLVATAVTSNGTYSRPDGYSSISVNVPQTGHTDAELEQKYQSGYTNGYNSGRTDGYDEGWQPGYNSGYTDGQQASQTTAYNSGYTNGYNDGTAAGFNSGYTNGKAEGYDSGYSAGIAYQKSLLASTAFTQNGTYTRENGWNSVNVSVLFPWMATAVTLNVATAITDYGQATATVTPSTATTNLVFSCSDDAVALIDPNTGTISAISDGTAIIRVTDTLSLLDDRKTVTFHKTLPPSGSGEYLTFECISAGTLAWITTNSSSINTPIQYRKNFGSWETAYPSVNTSDDPANILGTFAVGDVIEVKANAQTFSNYNVFQYFRGSGTYNIYGDITSMLGEYSGNPDTYTFHRMFRHINVVSAKYLDLSNLVLNSYGCYEMFRDNTHLLIAPDQFPNSQLARSCFTSMFAGCTNLISVPSALPATTLAVNCYQGMFGSCYSLTSTPALPATTLAEGCYQQMFLSCCGLTSGPALPATGLATNCYTQMFSGCKNLTSAPELPATVLCASCYSSMFYMCSNLETAPVLSATTLVERCYNSMFANCTKLNYVKCLATNPDATQNWTAGWLGNVAATGTFVKDANTTWSRSTNAIPADWTVVDAS